MLLLNFSIAQNAVGIYFFCSLGSFFFSRLGFHWSQACFSFIYFCSYSVISFQCLMLNMAALAKSSFLYNLGTFSIVTVSVPPTKVLQMLTFYHSNEVLTCAAHLVPAMKARSLLSYLRTLPTGQTAETLSLFLPDLKLTFSLHSVLIRNSYFLNCLPHSIFSCLKKKISSFPSPPSESTED